ncbi:hypothetical protein [Flavobacterium sp. CSZ]|uniref:hypothetical protein n=1 Tax=Flavobacterium sp. CSZ TaxID=2783791 RepID=UPI00188B1B2A|nr:hypothetical protein [Flavobacterium sp. CSZ]MBF4484393.1 hypothetical protein [Flavobacterium sp. CSZ]
MSKLKNNSEDFDLDLFFSERYIKVHLATAGARVPDRIFFDDSHSDFRRFINSAENKYEFEYRINPELDKILEQKFVRQGIDPKSFDRKSYLADFEHFAKKGIFSFDRTNISDASDYNFHLVAYPVLDGRYKEYYFHFLSSKGLLDRAKMLTDYRVFEKWWDNADIRDMLKIDSFFYFFEYRLMHDIIEDDNNYLRVIEWVTNSDFLLSLRNTVRK